MNKNELDFKLRDDLLEFFANYLNTEKNKSPDYLKEKSNSIYSSLIDFFCISIYGFFDEKSKDEIENMLIEMFNDIEKHIEIISVTEKQILNRMTPKGSGKNIEPLSKCENYSPPLYNSDGTVK